MTMRLEGDYVISDYPKPVGYMEILPQVEVHLSEKPNRFHLLMMRLLLGWQWHPYKKDDL